MLTLTLSLLQEKGMKDSLRVIGLKEPVFWLSWLLIYLCLSCVMVTIVVLIFKAFSLLTVKIYFKTLASHHASQIMNSERYLAENGTGLLQESCYRHNKLLLKQLRIFPSIFSINVFFFTHLDLRFSFSPLCPSSSTTLLFSSFSSIS